MAPLVGVYVEIRSQESTTTTLGSLFIIGCTFSRCSACYRFLFVSLAFPGSQLVPEPRNVEKHACWVRVGSSSHCHVKNNHVALIVAQQEQIISNSKRIVISKLPASLAFSTLRKSHKKVLTPVICLVLDRAVPRCRGHDDDERLEDSA